MNLQPLTPQSAGITGPMNINAVIAHLIEMTPGQRKQFAQLHMDDPMMLSAAKFVDNQISKQAQSLAAQATGTAPPPVNQQAVAQMSGSQMPEDTGIAQLPAENMPSEYAGGGIVAFNGKTGSKVEEEPVSMVGQLFNSVGDYIGNQYERNKLALKQASDYGEQERKRREAIPGLFEALTPSQKAARTEQMRAARAEQERIANTPLQASDTSLRVNDRTPRTPELYKPATPVSPEARRDDRPNLSSLKGQTEKPLPRAEPTRGSNGVAPVSQVLQTDSSEKAGGLEALLKGYQDAQGPAVDPYAAQHEENRKSREQMALADMAGAKERQAGIETLLSGKEARIAKREERLNQQDDVNLNMSLINAGLSMMQSTGKGLAGIAEGAQKGLGQYTEGLKMNEAARQKIEDARDAHDELRFNLNNMYSKEIQAAKRALEEGKIASTNEAITSIMHKEGLNRADATALFAARINQMAADKQMAHSEKLNALSIAAAAGNAAASRDLQRELAKMPDANQRFYASLSPTGNVREGYAFAMQQRGEGAMDKARLAQAEKFLENPINRTQSPELWKQAQAVVGGSFAPTVEVPNSNMRSRP